MGPIESWKKKTLLILLGKVENNKHPETETWHPESMFLLQAMWEFLITLWHGDRLQFIPNLDSKSLFLVNFTRIIWFFLGPGTYVIWYSYGCRFSRNFGFRQYFWFFGSKLGTKTDQNRKFACVRFESKFKLLKDFSNTVFALLEDYLWSNLNPDSYIS